jgi:hypothetical protein
MILAIFHRGSDRPRFNVAFKFSHEFEDPYIILANLQIVPNAQILSWKCPGSRIEEKELIL